MPIQIAQLVGGAGTGKTRELMACLDLAVQRLHDPHLIGFVSFTRAACDEAADRAADMLNMKRRDLRDHGWFKTMHGVCYRLLGVEKELLTGTAADRTWLQEALQCDVGGSAGEGDAEHLDVFEGAASDAERALALWGTARNRLQGLRPTWEAADACDDRTPDYQECVAIIERYEQAKRLDHRLDFVDLLARFADWRLRVDGPDKCAPDGEVPKLECWISDEHQDSSALLDSCFHRLIDAPAVKWVYIAGDPFQAIFGWAGSDHHFFLDYPTAKRRIMPKSWRCKQAILALGEDVLRDCTDYWDRGIQPAGPGGEVEERDWNDGWVDDLDPRESWLVLARTNFHASRIARRLDANGVPWLPTRRDVGCRWKAPVRNVATRALLNLEVGSPIDGDEWRAILATLPSKAGGVELLARGTKTEWAAMNDQAAIERVGWTVPEDLEQLGGTPALIEAIRTRQWRGLVDHADAYAAAVDRWGQEAVDAPKIQISTVHGAKGREAENVAVLTTISEPCVRAAQTDAGGDEENRVKYVALTRAKEKLVVLSENRTRFRWKLPV